MRKEARAVDGIRETMTALEYAAASAHQAAAAARLYSNLAACAQCAVFGIPYEGAARAALAPVAPACTPGIAVAPVPIIRTVPATWRAGIPVFGAVGAVPRLALPTYGFDGL